MLYIDLWSILSNADYAQLMRELLEENRLFLSAKSSPVNAELSNTANQ